MGHKNNSPSVKGRLQSRYDFWDQELQASLFVLAMVKHGYTLPFKERPPPFFAKNNASSRRNSKFVEESINELLSDGLVKEVPEKPYCCNPLTVAEGKKLRLVLDLRHVNEYIFSPKFKYEDLRTLANMFDKNFYFSTFDIKSGYHHVDITEEDQKYLGFSWIFPNGKTRYFQFTVLPFGLGSACYAFTKLMRPFVKKWRSIGSRSIIYLDDGISGALGHSKALFYSRLSKSDLENAGFIINDIKSMWDPVRIGEWLGFIVNTEKMEFSVPEKKVHSLLCLIHETLRDRHTTAKILARIAGKIIAMGLALGPLSRLFTRNIYKAIDCSPSWYSKLIIPEKVKAELHFWLRNLVYNNHYSIKPYHRTTKVVYSDASDTGYGGYTVSRLGEVLAKGNFYPDQIGTSSTFRELLAVKNVLQSFIGHLKHEQISWMTDNINAARILRVGSSKEQLQELAVDIFSICLRCDISINPVWIPREENQVSDDMSKQLDTDNWGIDLESFEYIQSKSKVFTVDRFADDINKKVQKFNSKYFCPGTDSVDAFTCDWHSEFNWLCPPIGLIGDALKHSKLCRSEGVLLIPEWKSAYYWPMLTSEGKVFHEFVKGCLVLDPFYISYNIAKPDSVFNGFSKFRTLALFITFG